MDLKKPLLQSWRTRARKEIPDEEKGGHQGGPVAKLQKSYFDVPGICCSSEIPLVENILKPVDGVKDVSVIVVSRTVIVVHDSLLVSQSQILDLLNKARLEASIKGSGEGIIPKKKWPGPYAISSGSLLLLSLFKYLYPPLEWLALGAVVTGIFPIIVKGIASVRGLRIDINILALSAVIGTIVLEDYIEAGTIVFLFTIAQWLESRASHKATAAMSSLMGMAPQKATIAETGQVVDVHDVQLNTVLAVKPGETVPMDGVVVDGISEVDEKTLTGESFPVPKQIDSPVWAGTINLNGYISVRTTALAEDCVVAKMAKLVEDAQSKKSGTQRFIDGFAMFYTPAVLVISIAFAVIPVALRVPDRDNWLRLALVVLVSACPCALILSTPVATFCALTKAAEHGILIKGGDYLEILGKIKTIALDKTGTITRGEFSVSEFRSLDAQVTLETLLHWVSSIESKSSHPMAAALVQYARSFGIEPRPNDIEDFRNLPGEGIYGRIDGRDVFIGNKRIANRAGSESVPILAGDARGGRTAGYVYVGATLVGIFSLSDECRTGVTEAIERLKKLNIKTAMLTGDTQEAAIHAQNHMHNALDLVYAELLPEEKLKIIEELKRDGPTAMVGDGVNDAPSLAASDIGISMGISGSALAVETGHVILMSNDIGKIPRAVILARRGQRKVVENVVISVLTKGAVLALAFAGYPVVWAAVLADTGTCLVVILNSMLLLRENRGDGPGEDRCRRSPFPVGQNQTTDEISSGLSHSNCCCEEESGSSIPAEDSCLIPQAPVLGSQRQMACCSSGKCHLEQEGLKEKVTCVPSYCRSNRYKTEAVPCKSRKCCSEKRCDQRQNSINYVASSSGLVGISDSRVNEVSRTGNDQIIHLAGNVTSSCSGSQSPGSVATGCCLKGRCSKSSSGLVGIPDLRMNEVSCTGDDQIIHLAGNVTSSCLGSQSLGSVATGCCSKGRCSKSSGGLVGILDSRMNEVSRMENDQIIHLAGNATSSCSGSQSPGSVPTSCCSKGRCSTAKGTAPAAARNLKESNLNARAGSVPGDMEPIQNSKDIESGIEETAVPVKSERIGGCCKKSNGKECCGGSACPEQLPVPCQ